MRSFEGSCWGTFLLIVTVSFIFPFFCGTFLDGINERSFGSTARMCVEVRQANECDVKCDALIMPCFTCDLLVPSGKVTLTGFVCMCMRDLHFCRASRWTDVGGSWE